MEDLKEVDDIVSARKINGTQVDTSCWLSPDVGAFDDETRAQFTARKNAVKLYLRGGTKDELKELYGLGAKQVYRLIKERCLQPHPDGLVYGWRALIPHLHINPYHRITKLNVTGDGRGAVGAMTLLLENETALAKGLAKRVLRQPTGKQLTELPSIKGHVSWFLTQLRQLGYELRNEWPFNTASNGYYAIYRHVKKLLADNPRAAALAAGGPDLAKKLISGDGVDRPIKNIFGRVEMDAHKLDGRFCVMIPQLDGDYLAKVVHRLWVTVILDVASRAVLGYHFSMRREVSKEDVLAAIKCALTEWKKRDIHFSDEPYSPDACLPSGVRKEWIGLCWDETSVDGALAQTCKTVRSKLKEVVGSELIEPNSSFAIRRSKDDRPFIETFFRRLGSGGFQRMSNTTGKGPSDKKGRKPDEVAITSQFQYEYAEELLDVLIANYNASAHSSHGSRTPLQYLHFATNRADFTPRYADEELVQQLVSFRKKCLVKGGAAEGRAPYVNFVLGKYSNEILSSRNDLVGREVWVINHLETDARVVMCSTIDGEPLGVLRASPPWHQYPHSLSVRRAICAAVRRGSFAFSEGADGVETFLNFVEQQRDRKLPVHPAYLEARRIITASAQEMMGVSVVAQAEGQSSTPDHAVRKPKLALVDSASNEQQGSVRKLPGRRMAGD